MSRFVGVGGIHDMGGGMAHIESAAPSSMHHTDERILSLPYWVHCFSVKFSLTQERTVDALLCELESLNLMTDHELRRHIESNFDVAAP